MVAGTTLRHYQESNRLNAETPATGNLRSSSRLPRSLLKGDHILPIAVK